MKKRRILFIGNSFTMGSGDTTVFEAGGVPFLVSELAAAAGAARPITRLCAAGGRHFYDHLADETGALTAIREGGWDEVVLQEFSTFPTHAGDIERFMADGTRLHREIQQASPGARTVLFETWAREATHALVHGDNAAFAGGWREMQAELTQNYRSLARTLRPDVTLAPVGEVWEALLLQSDPPRLHARDNYHAGAQGSFAAAVVITRTIFDGLPLQPPALSGISIDMAERIMAAAEESRQFPMN